MKRTPAICNGAAYIYTIDHRIDCFSGLPLRDFLQIGAYQKIKGIHPTFSPTYLDYFGQDASHRWSVRQQTPAKESRRRPPEVDVSEYLFSLAFCEDR